MRMCKLENVQMCKCFRCYIPDLFEFAIAQSDRPDEFAYLLIF